MSILSEYLNFLNEGAPGGKRLAQAIKNQCLKTYQKCFNSSGPVLDPKNKHWLKNDPKNIAIAKKCAKVMASCLSQNINRCTDEECKKALAGDIQYWRSK